MLNVNGFIAKGKKISNELNGDLLENYKDLSTWTKTGVSTDIYSDGENNISFEKTVITNYAAYLKADIQNRFNVTLTDTAINVILNYWCYIGYGLFGRTDNGTTTLYVGANGNSTSENITVEYPVLVMNADGTYNINQSTVISSYSQYPNQYYYGTVQDFLKVPNYSQFNSMLYQVYSKNLNQSQFRNILQNMVLNPSYKLNTSTLGSDTQYMLMAGANLYKSGTRIYWVSPYSYYVNNADTSSGVKYNNYDYDESEYLSRYWGTLSDISQTILSSNPVYTISPITDTGYYLFKLKAYSPTGFDPSANYVVKAGSSSISISNVSGNEYEEYYLMFNGTSGTQIKLDFSLISSMGTNSFKIKDVGLYPIVN